MSKRAPINRALPPTPPAADGPESGSLRDAVDRLKAQVTDTEAFLANVQKHLGLEELPTSGASESKDIAQCGLAREIFICSTRLDYLNGRLQKILQAI